MATRAGHRLPSSRRLRNAARCLHGLASRPSTVVYKLGVFGRGTVGAAAPPDRYSARREDGVRCRDDEGERIPRPPWPSKPKRLLTRLRPTALLAPVSTLPDDSVTFLLAGQPRPAWRYAAGVSILARRSGGSPRSKNQGEAPFCGSPPRQSRPARGQSAGADELDNRDHTCGLD